MQAVIKPKSDIAHPHTVVSRLEAARMGLWVFITTEILFFGVLFTGYVMSRLRAPEAFIEASRHTDLILGTLETAVLLTSSLTMALAVLKMKAGKIHQAARLLILTILLGLIFCGIHGVEYYHDYHEHLFPNSAFDLTKFNLREVKLFFFLYFVMTGFHIVHVIVGVMALSLLVYLTRKHRFSDRYSTSIEMTGLYWHFVDIIWVYLYPLFYLVYIRG